MAVHYLTATFAMRPTKFNIYMEISSGEFFSCHKIQDFGCGGRATVGAMGLNPASDLNEREYNVNQMREANSF